MPQQIFLPSRNITVEYPDDATDEQIKADIEQQYPRTGQDVAYDAATQNFLDYRPTFDDYMKMESYLKEKKKDDPRSIVERGIDTVQAFGTGLGGMLKDIGKGIAGGASLAANGQFQKGLNSLIEGFAQGVAGPAMMAYSTEPDSPFFKFKSFITGTGTPQERYEQFLKAREMQGAMQMAESGEMPIIREFAENYDPATAKAASYALDGFMIGGLAAKAMKGAGALVSTGSVLEKAAAEAALERQVAGTAASMAGAAEGTARGMSYLTDFRRAAQAYADNIIQTAQKEAGDLVDLGKLDEAQTRLTQAQQEAQKIIAASQNKWTIGASWLATAAAYGIGGHKGPLIFQSLRTLGEGATKGLEFVAGMTREAAEQAAKEGAGQITGMERLASQGASTYTRSRAAKIFAKYAPPEAASIAWDATKGGVLGATIGAALGYGMTGDVEKAAESAGAGFGLGAGTGLAYGIADAVSGGKYANRVLRDFARDLESRPDTVSANIFGKEPVTQPVRETFNNFFEDLKTQPEKVIVDAFGKTETGDPLGGGIKIEEKVIPVEINDKAARQKIVERFTGKDLARLLNVTQAAERSGTKIAFHDDSFKAGDLSGSQYNGVTVLDGVNGQPTILLNVDRMKPSTASHEVVHALATDDFKRGVREAIMGDVDAFSPTAFAASPYGKQLKKFVDDYASMLPESGWADRAKKAFETVGMDSESRALAMADAIEEFGAYYFENWLQNKSPNILLPEKINFWENTFNTAKQKLWEVTGKEQMKAMGASVDPATGNFYKNGRRVRIPELEQLSRQFAKDLVSGRLKRAPRPAMESFAVPTAERPQAGFGGAAEATAPAGAPAPAGGVAPVGRPMSTPVSPGSPASATPGMPGVGPTAAAAATMVRPPTPDPVDIASVPEIKPVSYDDYRRDPITNMLTPLHENKPEDATYRKSLHKRVFLSLGQNPNLGHVGFESAKEFAESGRYPANVGQPRVSRETGLPVPVGKDTQVWYRRGLGDSEVEALLQTLDPQGGATPSQRRFIFEGKEADIKKINKAIKEGIVFEGDFYHDKTDIIPNAPEARTYYTKDPHQYLATAFYASEESAPGIAVFDLTNIKNAVRDQFNLPTLREQIKQSYGGFHATQDEVVSAIKPYLENISLPKDQRVDTAALFGGGVKGRFMRDSIQRAMQVNLRKGYMESFYPGKEQQVSQPRKRADYRSGGTELPFQRVRLDRIRNIRLTDEKISFNPESINEIRRNFQPADTLREQMGNGIVFTDGKNGWRIITKDGKKFRLFSPTGIPYGVYNSLQDAKIASNKQRKRLK